MSDYVTDTKSVLDQALRVLQAIVDVAADGGWLETTVGAMWLAQMVTQGRWLDAPGLDDLPHMDEAAVRAPRRAASCRSSSCSRRRRTRCAGCCRAASRTESSRSSRRSYGRPARAPQCGGARGGAPARRRGRVVVHLEALHAASRSSLAPRFLPKLAGWWLVMGEEGVELLALKRVRFDCGRMQTELQFAAPDEPGEYVWKVMLISDSYIGLDQEVEIRIQVLPRPVRECWGPP